MSLLLMEPNLGNQSGHHAEFVRALGAPAGEAARILPRITTPAICRNASGRDSTT